MTSVLTLTRVATPTIAKEEKKMGECPFCGASFDADGFDELEDCGDYVVGTASITCPECGKSFRVYAHFDWDGELEID